MPVSDPSLSGACFWSCPFCLWSHTIQCLIPVMHCSGSTMSATCTAVCCPWSCTVDVLFMHCPPLVIHFLILALHFLLLALHCLLLVLHCLVYPALYDTGPILFALDLTCLLLIPFSLPLCHCNISGPCTACFWSGLSTFETEMSGPHFFTASSWSWNVCSWSCTVCSEFSTVC